MAKVFVSVTLRRLTGGAREADVPGSTLGEIIDGLEALYPGFRAGVVRGDRMKPGVSALIDGRGSATHLSQEVREDAEVHIFFAISGG